MPQLSVRTKQGTMVQTVALAQKPLTVGRAENCDIILRNDAEVSREHAHIWSDDDGVVYVRDRNSKNGTRVDDSEPFRNDTRAVRRCIRIGDHEIAISGTTVPPPDTVRFMQDPPTQRPNASFYSSATASGKVELTQQRLSLLISLTERIGGAFDRKQLLEEALGACCEALGFERCLIALKTARGETEPPITRNIQRDETGAYKVSRTLIRSALEEGKQCVVNDPATDLINSSESVVRLQIRSALCVPIMNREKILGVIYGDCILDAAKYQKDDVDFLGAIARQVGVGITNLRLLQDYVENQKLAVQLDQARRFQKRLLPSNSGEFGRVLISGYNEPSEQVGGDYFDYFAVGEDRVGFIIADVSGHGLSAAMVMANFQAAVQVTLTPEISLPDVATRLNRFCCRHTSASEFITGVIGWINRTTGLIEYINAGHPSPVMVGTNLLEIPEIDNSLPFGIDPEDTYRVITLSPSRGFDTILFYTDGLVEATNPAGEQFGVDPVCALLRELPQRSCDEIIQRTLDLWRTHLAGAEAADDLTLKVIRLQ